MSPTVEVYIKCLDDKHNHYLEKVDQCNRNIQLVGKDIENMEKEMETASGERKAALTTNVDYYRGIFNDLQKEVQAHLDILMKVQAKKEDFETLAMLKLSEEKQDEFLKGMDIPRTISILAHPIPLHDEGYHVKKQLLTVTTWFEKRFMGYMKVSSFCLNWNSAIFIEIEFHDSKIKESFSAMNLFKLVHLHNFPEIDSMWDGSLIEDVNGELMIANAKVANAKVAEDMAQRVKDTEAEEREQGKRHLEAIDVSSQQAEEAEVRKRALETRSHYDDQGNSRGFKGKRRRRTNKIVQYMPLIVTLTDDITGAPAAKQLQQRQQGKRHLEVSSQQSELTGPSAITSAAITQEKNPVPLSEDQSSNDEAQEVPHVDESDDEE